MVYYGKDYEGEKLYKLQHYLLGTLCKTLTQFNSDAAFYPYLLCSTEVVSE